MRTLQFIVSGNSIIQNPTCKEFETLFPTTNPKTDIQAEFVFSPEWDKRVKVVAFWSILDKEYPPQALNDDNICLIPAEALARPAFKLQVIGKRNGRIYKTNKLTVYQRGGAK